MYVSCEITTWWCDTHPLLFLRNEGFPSGFPQSFAEMLPGAHVHVCFLQQTARGTFFPFLWLPPPVCCSPSLRASCRALRSGIELIRSTLSPCKYHTRRVWLKLFQSTSPSDIRVLASQSIATSCSRSYDIFHQTSLLQLRDIMYYHYDI